MRISNVVFSAALTVALLSACTAGDETVMAQRQTVDTTLPTANAELREVEQESQFDGVIEAISQSTVSAQTSGRIITLPFDVGDSVAAGDEIVRITSAEQGSRVDAAQSALAEAIARRKEADQAYARAEDVYNRKLISKADFDRVSANRDAARAQVESAQANLSTAQEALKYTVVRAPYAGTVLERHVRLGEVVAPGTPLMTGVSLDNLRVVVNLPQTHVAVLQSEQKARVVLNDGSVIVPSAVRIPMAADPGTHSFRVRLELPDDAPPVLPGALVKVAFTEGQKQSIVVPEPAVVRRGELTAVYVRQDSGALRLRYVRLGSTLGDGTVVIAAGLDAGESIVLDPVRAAAAYKAQAFIGAAAAEGAAHE